MDNLIFVFLFVLNSMNLKNSFKEYKEHKDENILGYVYFMQLVVGIGAWIAAVLILGFFTYLIL